MVILGRLPQDSWQRMQKERETALRNCYDELRSFEANKLTLTEPTFFIPGWTGEDARTWFDDPHPHELYKPSNIGWTESSLIGILPGALRWKKKAASPRTFLSLAKT